MSIRGLPGKRVEAYRAGRTPTWKSREGWVRGEVVVGDENGREIDLLVSIEKNQSSITENTYYTGSLLWFRDYVAYKDG